MWSIRQKRNLLSAQSTEPPIDSCCELLVQSDKRGPYLEAFRPCVSGFRAVC